MSHRARIRMNRFRGENVIDVASFPSFDTCCPFQPSARSCRPESIYSSEFPASAKFHKQIPSLRVVLSLCGRCRENVAAGDPRSQRWEWAIEVTTNDEVVPAEVVPPVRDLLRERLERVPEVVLVLGRPPGLEVEGDEEHVPPEHHGEPLVHGPLANARLEVRGHQHEGLAAVRLLLDKVGPSRAPRRRAQANAP